MFALGGRAFTKRLSTLLGVPFEEAEQLKLRYSAGSLQGPQRTKVSEALRKDAGVWRDGVELSLGDFRDLELLPTRILLCGGGSYLPEIKSSLEAKDWWGKLPFAKAPTVHFISPTDVKSLRDETGMLRGREDITPLGLANLALELAGEEEVVPSLLRKAVKLLQN
jgi:hypothetical protein